MFVCESCPLKAACYADAVARSEVDGVWGGVCFNGETARRLKAKARRERGRVSGPAKGSLVGGAVLRAAQTHCKRGHEFDEVNTELRVGRSGRPNRRCRKCKSMLDRESAQRRALRRVS